MQTNVRFWQGKEVAVLLSGMLGLDYVIVMWRSAVLR